MSRSPSPGRRPAANGSGGCRTTGPIVARARAAYDGRDWSTALELLLEADRSVGLEPPELEILAECARWLGRNDVVIGSFERAHRAYSANGSLREACRTALALCAANDDVCNAAVAASWWKRADEIIGSLPEGPEHAAHAWFLARTCSARGDLDGQEAAARRADALARRHGDRNVEALAQIEIGHVATARGRGPEARQAIERATALAVGGELGVLESGIVFCNAIWAYRCRGEWDHASEWTESASRWAENVRVAYFPGLCRVHRSEVLRIRGELVAAEHESREATRFLESDIPRWAMVAHAEVGEVRRRRGDADGALESFRRALDLGWDPQPGLALLLLDLGDPVAAHNAIERVFVDRVQTLIYEDRASLLAARATIAVAAGKLATAEQAAEELERLAESNPTPGYAAASAHARGETELARGRPDPAARHFARAHRAWADLQAPYEVATSRAALGRALLAQGDEGGGRLELGAAERIFERIGAKRERERVAGLLADLCGSGARTAHATTARAPAGVAELRREGDYWTMSFGEWVLRLKDGRGPRYLAILLSRPDADLWSIDLVQDASDHRDAGAARAPAGDAGEVLDEEARASYRRRLEELQSDLDDARERGDDAATETLLEEMDELGRALAAAIGLGGRPRRVGSDVERARQSVTKALRGTLRKIAAANAWLGHYLETTVHTGTACRFEPDARHPIEWVVHAGDGGGRSRRR